ncbi:MAG TPA: phosphopentomutase [Armatimonadota bacterium]|nr:phosphopentomutase [Armatimonadota bacterium]
MQSGTARVTVVVLDSAGIGSAPDAADFGDAGSDTLGNLSRAVGGLRLPNLGALGLGNVAGIEGVPPAGDPRGAHGRMIEQSAGKDTVNGHWEMMGVVSRRPFPVYPDGFPADLIAELGRRCGRPVIGNRPASGTLIIEELIAEHLRTGALIVYTSGDSVMQIAAHESVLPMPELYRCCQIARELAVGEHVVERIIARPFIGEPGHLVRTDRRRDWALPPPGRTVLDELTDAGMTVCGIGKIGDIFAHRGVSEEVHTRDNADGCRRIIERLDEQREGMIFANLNDFDSKYGHRNDAPGYAAALEEVDGYLPAMFERLSGRDLLFITADHGCDPTTASTNHSREQVPLLVAGPALRPVDLGVRDSFADLGATVAEAFGLQPPEAGRSFLREIIPGGGAP